MSKKKNELTVQSESKIDELAIFSRVSSIIENRKFRAQAKANQESVLMFWEIGKYIGSVLLEGQRSEYGKQILVTLSQELQTKHGSCFEYSNITRMVKFANRFSDIETIVELASQLSWSHFIALLPLKTDEAFMYYAKDASSRLLSVRELRNQISRKAFERKEIANTQFSETSAIPLNMFKDPYLLDVLGLKENYLEADLEKAILADLEAFILEFGHGFTFVNRQKRMTMDGADFTLDLLFYHRILKRLVAVELKIGEFKPSYSGQMRFYLKWLNRFERQEGENPPIGLILCTEASRDQIELMELDKEGIAVAEYWTAMPPKVVFEKKIKEIVEEAQERLKRRKMLTNDGIEREIEYFYEAKDDVEN
ncbi:MAG: PDDEXK nuclease domain-containing protein [Oscillospiraceae bacterium]|nr:PDDEXK nuclease domain-containing protein [Oscillospiraceae bacterium]